MHQDTTGYVCLLIQPARKADAGWYTLSAKNEAGIVSCTARLDIYGKYWLVNKSEFIFSDSPSSQLILCSYVPSFAMD